MNMLQNDENPMDSKEDKYINFGRILNNRKKPFLSSQLKNFKILRTYHHKRE